MNLKTSKSFENQLSLENSSSEEDLGGINYSGLTDNHKKALYALKKTDLGLGFLTKFALAKQKIGATTFDKSGEYSRQGYSFEFTTGKGKADGSSSSTPEGRTTYYMSNSKKGNINLRDIDYYEPKDYFPKLGTPKVHIKIELFTLTQEYIDAAYPGHKGYIVKFYTIGHEVFGHADKRMPSFIVYLKQFEDQTKNVSKESEQYWDAAQLLLTNLKDAASNYAQEDHTYIAQGKNSVLKTYCEQLNAAYKAQEPGFLAYYDYDRKRLK